MLGLALYGISLRDQVIMAYLDDMLLAMDMV